jgi:hypothetical protein
VRVAALYDVHGNLPALTAEVVGFSAAAHQTAFHAFSWTKQGGLIDLGPKPRPLASRFHHLATHPTEGCLRRALRRY